MDSGAELIPRLLADRPECWSSSSPPTPRGDGGRSHSRAPGTICPNPSPRAIRHLVDRLANDAGSLASREPENTLSSALPTWILTPSRRACARCRTRSPARPPPTCRSAARGNRPRERRGGARPARPQSKARASLVVVNCPTLSEEFSPAAVRPSRRIVHRAR